ncbi:uncharacterized protein LAESUDRAFT_724330 [Laetiporus sulphureus 93-53]|uniref:Zn(2)-C6 fungal-type domain-containing protein n=1 Tax=Laetiporus sulphureus 93-53 TaxID=1314785 RepID=A0A165EVL0_9APHY|nr:uncharacterized protein LAESUDRAFT_724330 [Laetiporus sulphureus 93-53]KZT07857.1 hypothetical protein LAESUDRAFT_724330 [Laetiporus sulphureus 93-53]
MSFPQRDDACFDASRPSHLSRAAAVGLNIAVTSGMQDVSGPHAPSPAAYSEYSAMPSTPATPSDAPATPLDANRNSEDSWNLIPYNVPWGSEYFDYQPGTLPGPDGSCVFLRSPTPLKNKRTTRACTKCRERKAKCSGTRPTCSRCLSRGYICQYDLDDSKRSSAANLARQRRRSQATLSTSSSFSSLRSVTAFSDRSDYSQASSSLRRELVEASSSTSSLAYSVASTASTTSTSSEPLEAWWPFERPPSASYIPFAEGMPADPYPKSIHAISEEANFPSAMSVHAPRPVKCSQAVPFLTHVQTEMSEAVSAGGFADASMSIAVADDMDVNAYAYVGLDPFDPHSYGFSGDHMLFQPFAMPPTYLSPFGAMEQDMMQTHYEPPSTAASGYNQDIGIVPQRTYDAFVA